MQAKNTITPSFLRAFTLLELLVVVCILAILSALAIPHFMEAQTRSKVAVAKNNLRIVAGALEAYHVDASNYPPMRSLPPEDPLGLLAASQLSFLTTPVCYTSAAAFHDPFGTIRQRIPGLNTMRAREASPSDTELPVPSVVNSSRSLLYYEYKSFSLNYQRPDMQREAAAAISIGPDARDSFAVYAPFPDGLPEAARLSGLVNPVDCLYDATNGTVSEGDIPRYTGAIPNNLQP